MSDKSPLTAADLSVLLRARYAPPAWAYLPQVRNGTGGTFSRTADALAVSLWPSRGIELIGLEIKVSRSDWQRELKDPRKADQFGRYCHRWYIVAPVGLVGAPELPPRWGLLTPRGTGLFVQVESPPAVPEPLPLPMLAAILRNVADATKDMVPRNEVHIEAGRISAAKLGQEENNKVSKLEYELTTLRADHKQLQQAVTAFEDQTGAKLNYYTSRTLVEAVRLIQDGGVNRMRRELEELRRRARHVADTLDTCLAQPEGAAPECAP